MKLFRRFTALFLALLLFAAPARAASVTFSDVPASHWAGESIRRAAELGLVGGVGGGRFGLGQQVTRGQYATMLCRLMGWEMLSPEKGSFDDNQDRSAWYYSPIETAYAHGALLKLGRTCKPEEPLPREEMAVMTLRALGYGDGVLAGIVQSDCPFSDVTTNRGYIALAYRMGFMSGTGGTRFSPKDVSTREQAAAVLLRVYDRTHGGLGERTVLYSHGEAVPEAAVYVEPLAAMQASVPMCPRAPLESVYAAAVKAGEGGTVALRTTPWAVTVKAGSASGGEAITVERLNELLADSGTQVAHSARYGSSYLTHTAVDGTKTYVWYETADDIAAKVELCKLLGVSAVYIDE